MYIIKRNNKRFNNKKFSTYEEARSYVRKWIRKFSWKVVYDMELGRVDKSDYYYCNPSISKYKFKISSI